jgi:methionine synthase II (cobalamin-independent)
MTGTLKDVVKVPLPTTQTGRYPRPSWYDYMIKDNSWADACSDPRFLEAYTDGVKVILDDHESEGLDIVTDGCLRFDLGLGTIASWNTNNLAYFGGLKRASPRPEGKTVMSSVMGEKDANAYYKFKAWRFGSEMNWWVAEEEPSVGKLGVWTEAAKIAAASTKKALKFNGPSAAMCSHYTMNRSRKSDRDIFFAFARAQNKVLREIADAGVQIIQLDYPFGFAHWSQQFAKLSQEAWKDLVSGFNEEVSGVKAQIWVHFCFGAPILYTHEVAPYTYHMADVYPNIAECKADCLQSEAANTDGRYLEKELKSWKESCPEKDYAVGAVTPYDLLETAVDVDKIIEIALKYVPPEKLALSSDEGLAAHGFLTRNGAKIKMRLLSEAAKRARKRF